MQKIHIQWFDQKILLVAFIAAFGLVGGLYLYATNAQSYNGSSNATAECQNGSGATYEGIPVACSEQMVFASNRSGYYQLYDKNLVNGALTALTSGQSNNMGPEPSPDGTELVFYSNISGDYQIFELNVAHPSDVTQLTHDTGGVNNYDPVFSTDGKSIYFRKTDSKGNYGDIWRMNVDGSSPVDLTPDMSAQGIEAWKPVPVSDTQLVFTERTQPNSANATDNIYSLNTNTDTTTALTESTTSSWSPSYSPQAGKVLFVQTPSNGTDVIESMNLDGSDDTPVVHMSGDDDDPSWVDGQSTLFINSSTGQYNVYLASSNGKKIALVDSSPKNSNDFSPVMLP